MTIMTRFPAANELKSVLEGEYERLSNLSKEPVLYSSLDAERLRGKAAGFKTALTIAEIALSVNPATEDDVFKAVLEFTARELRDNADARFIKEKTQNAFYGKGYITGLELAVESTHRERKRVI